MAEDLKYTMTSNISTVPESCSNVLGETPVYCDWLRKLFWVDILNQELFSYSLESGKVKQTKVPMTVSAMLLCDKKGIFLLVSDQGLFLFNEEEGLVVNSLPIDYPEQSTRPNECQIDPSGSLIMSTMDWNAKLESGSWYRYSSGDHSFTKLLGSITIPNTLVFQNEKILYGDTVRECLFEVEASMPNWEDSKCICQIDGGALDGSCLTEEGYLIGARWGLSKLTVYNTHDNMKVVDEIELPASQPTSCLIAEGHLYITTANYSLADPVSVDGKLLKAETSLTGSPQYRFKL